MTEYITKDQAYLCMLENWDGDMLPGDYDDLLREIPPADVAQVVHATTSGEYWDEAYCKWKACDNCHGDNVSAAKYCNWCGARLDGGEK